MSKKKKVFEDLTLYLPAPGFKKRFMPPFKICVDPGSWEKQPLFLSSLKVDEPGGLVLFDLIKKEMI